MGRSQSHRIFTLSLVAACAVFATGLWAAEAAKLELNFGQRGARMFNVQRTSHSEGTSSNGDFKSDSTTDIRYRIRLAEKKDSGDMVLEVTYGAVKVKSEGSRGGWEFDSAKEGEGDEAAASLKEVLKKTITVTVSEGIIKEVSGFPEAEEGGRGFRGRMVASPFALRRDLELILSLPVLGKALEEKKVYQMARPEQPSDAGGRRFRGFRERVAYTYDGQEQVGRGNVAKFSLSAAPSEREGGEERPNISRKITGTALIALRDGLLRRLNIESSSEMKGERDGQSFSFKRSSTTTIQRARPQGAPGRGRGKRAEKKEDTVDV